MGDWLERKSVRLGTGWVLVAALCFAGSWSLRAPSPVDTDAPLDTFSAARALQHIEVIADEPHPMGSPEIAQVRTYLHDQLRALGLSPVSQTISAPDYFGAPNRTVEVVNVMARIAGTDPTGAIVLMGHYDSVPTTPGANDNSAAVATLLETARVLQTGEPFRNDIILLFTDGEEPAPRYGSSAYVAEHPWAVDSRLVVNLEAIGGSGPSLLLETNGSQSRLVSGFSEESQHPAVFSFITGIVEAIDAGATDFTPFRDAGVPGLHFAYLRGSSIYHTTDDALESVSLASLQHHGEHTTAVLQAFGDVDLAEAEGDDAAVFFTIGNALVIRYPSAWAIPLAILSALGAIGALRAARRGRRRAVLAGARRVGLHLVGAGLFGAVGWRLVTALSPTPSAMESAVYLALFAAVACGFYALRSPGGNDPKTDIAGGALVVWLFFAIVVSLLVPPAGYVFVWPVIAATLAMVWADRGRAARAVSQVARLAMVAAPTLLLLLPVLDFLFQLVQPRPGNTDSQLLDFAALVAIVVMLMIELIGPYMRLHPESRSSSSASSATMTSTTSATERPVVSTAGNRP